MTGLNKLLEIEQICRSLASSLLSLAVSTSPTFAVRHKHNTVYSQQFYNRQQISNSHHRQGQIRGSAQFMTPLSSDIIHNLNLILAPDSVIYNGTQNQFRICVPAEIVECLYLQKIFHTL